MTDQTIGNAPSGENSSPAGTEKFPVSGSKYILLSTIRDYIWNYLTSLTAKTSIVDADQLSLADSAASNVSKKITFANFMASIATYTATWSNKTLTTPTIGSFVNATHTHRGAAQGGSLTQIRGGTVGDPASWYTNRRPQIFMFRADAALTITRIHISGGDSTPTSEMAGDLKFADDTFTGGFANATVIDVCDTTNGVFTATSSFDDATVPSGKYVYFQMDSAPHADWKDFFIEVHFTYD